MTTAPGFYLPARRPWLAFFRASSNSVHQTAVQMGQQPEHDQHIRPDGEHGPGPRAQAAQQ
jgi:hypothetical protein